MMMNCNVPSQTPPCFEEVAWILLNTVENVQQQINHCLGNLQRSGRLTTQQLSKLEQQHWELKLKLGLFVGTHPLVQQYQSTQDSLTSLLHQSDEDLLECLELDDSSLHETETDLEAAFLFHQRQKYSTGMAFITDELHQVSEILSLLHRVLLVRPQALFHSEVQRFSRLSQGVVF